ncbi:hypothetical protein VF21_06400 [Pseudogymnoascus sp. 05NY08]|nr:hypothetical protein VF21_06400 [Pseudogymnoascus sp. 05NY08]
MPKRPKARVVKCVRRRYARGQYTDMGEDKCCSDCGRGASEDQSLIPNLAPMLSNGECKSIIFGPASPQGSPLRVSQIYGIVRFKATIPASTGDNPQSVTCDIPVNGLFNEQNSPLVQNLFEMVDTHFVPKIVGKTQQDCQLIANACRGFGLCKLLIMAEDAKFKSSDLQSDFIWVVVQQIDRLLQMSLLKVRSGSLIIDEGSSSQLIIWYYALSKLKRSMKCAKHGQSANLFGSRELFQHVWCWVGHAWEELSNRWKTACRQQDDFYKGFRTAHEEIAKMVHNFTIYFEMSMWELPAEPSRPVDYNGLHQFEPPTDWALIQQQTISPAREAYGQAPIAYPNYQSPGHHLANTPSSGIYGASFNPVWLDGNSQLPFNGVANRYSNSNQSYSYPTMSYHLDQHLSNSENFWAGYDTWPSRNQIPVTTRGYAMGTSSRGLVPEESHFSHEHNPFFQQPFIQRPPQSEYLPQMLLADSIQYTFRGDASTIPKSGPCIIIQAHTIRITPQGCEFVF